MVREMQTKLWKYPHDVEKTEAWLNELARNGFICVGVDALMSRYTFEQGTQGEYVYHYVLFDKFFGHSKSIRYLSFLNESGIECVGHAFQHVLLRKKAANGDINLLTDRNSQIKYYERILASDTIIGTVALLTGMLSLIYALILGHTNIAAGIGHFSSHINLLTILAYAIGVIGAGVTISYIRQWRRYALRIKNLKRDSLIFE